MLEADLDAFSRSYIIISRTSSHPARMWLWALIGPANNVRLLPTRTRGDPFRCYDQSLCYVGEDLIKYRYTIPSLSVIATYVLVFIPTVIND